MSLSAFRSGDACGHVYNKMLTKVQKYACGSMLYAAAIPLDGTEAKWHCTVGECAACGGGSGVADIVLLLTPTQFRWRRLSLVAASVAALQGAVKSKMHRLTQFATCFIETD